MQLSLRDPHSYGDDLYQAFSSKVAHFICAMEIVSIDVIFHSVGVNAMNIRQAIITFPANYIPDFA
jgi:hypothetical protein